MISRNILIRKEDRTTTPGIILHSITGIREEFRYVSVANNILSQIRILAATEAIVKLNWFVFFFSEEFQSILI